VGLTLALVGRLVLHAGNFTGLKRRVGKVAVRIALVKMLSLQEVV
jgi:hypothetical protein